LSPLPVSLDQALAFRLERQHLTRPAANPEAAAAALFGAQAQVQSAALLQLRARTDGVTDHALRDALLTERSLVKLWAQRSTLHLIPTRDLGLLLAMRRLAVRNYHNWYGKEGLQPDQIERLVAAIAEALADGPHSRMDLSRRLSPVLGDWARPWLEHSWGGAIKLACALGHVCHGPAMDDSGGERANGSRANGNREAAFVRLDRWVGVPAVPDSRDGMKAVLRRYLAAFGPATIADFRKFTGLSGAPAPQAFADLRPELIPVDLDGRPGWALAADEGRLRAAEPAEGRITVLPLFDPWLLAHADTAQTVAPSHRKAVYRTAGWISATILRQGRVIATWGHKRTAGGWSVDIRPLTRIFKKELPPIEQALRHLSGGLPVTFRMME